MKAKICLTAALSLLLPHETFATAASPGNLLDDEAQLTLHDTRLLRLTYDHGTIRTHQHAEHAVFAPLAELQDALKLMQDTWFELWVGTWPTAIDWTAAVLNTQLVSSLSTLSKALKFSNDEVQDRDVENDLDRYFSQNVAYYFGENAFSIRNQAYDDMLWVVLGWLESIRFVRGHSDRHYCMASSGKRNPKPWQGTQFIEAFSHRARIFYDLARRGWDESLCGGGMVWSPYLGPYKNAITNQLYISASIGMYLHFAGDNNTMPFALDGVDHLGLESANPHDPAYLHAAVKAYDWLKNSNMQNGRGLYVDGFHVSNWKDNGTTCDQKNMMVFTYNQGVILSGLRGLWEGTGNTTYLKDAHKLVRDVIKAAGWDIESSNPSHENWSGLGRNGVLEDHCDASEDCSQDAQTFKGIFFHHLTLLCEPLPLHPLVPGLTFAADEALASLHRRSCREYAPWIAHNAKAAVESKDEEGRFGMWWGGHEGARQAPLPEGAVDYVNNVSELLDPRWQKEGDDGAHRLSSDGKQGPLPHLAEHDLDDRGRTVETQSGGVAVLRALWEFVHL